MRKCLKCSALTAVLVFSAIGCTNSKTPELVAGDATEQTTDDHTTGGPQEYIDAYSATRNLVRVNQAGVRPHFPKFAIVESDAELPLDWTLISKDRKVVARGSTSPKGRHLGSGKSVHQVNFSDFRDSGEGYRIVVEGVGKSHPFNIDENVYQKLKYDALSYFYQARAGVPIEEAYVQGVQWARPAGHESEIVTCFKGKDRYNVEWPGCDYSLDVTGGWYDAGDHGKYTVNSGISTWSIMQVVELGLPGFDDGAVLLPEAGNGINDALDEARFNVDFMLAMQVPEGSHSPVVLGRQSEDLSKLEVSVVDVSGMAHHKVAGVSWSHLPTAPHESLGNRFLYPPSTTATLNLVAVGAQCARVYKNIDPVYADKCLSAAVSAYGAAKRVSNAFSYDNFDGSGPYDSIDPRNEFYWAAAELYATTKDEVYKADVVLARDALAEYPMSGGREPNWMDTQILGTITMALHAPDQGLREDAQKSLFATADKYVQQLGEEPYLIPFLKEKWRWGSLGELANRGMVLAIAYDLAAKEEYLDAAAATMDYILGRNPMDFSYISGYGERSFSNPHHRFWARAVDPSYPGPPPGVLSGGPNNAQIAGPVSKVLVEVGCKAQTCYADHIDAYELNEVTINWNAPIVFLAAWLDSVEQKKNN